MGIDFPLHPQDVAVRADFITLYERGIITDRRAGRISDEVEHFDELSCRRCDEVAP